ncbi:MAG: polysaccharide biosynthesis protein [Proteobacteria bacterium]|nr:polysaccharide biosynthesis protein [Pseudomonadota bacterium]
MYRQIIGYIPANVIPAIVSTLMIYAYTRLLSPAAFGIYSYIFAATLVVQTSLFYAVPIAVMRFYPAAARDGRELGLLKETYIVFYSLALFVCLLSVGVALAVPLPESYRFAAWLALPMLLTRSLVQLNQSINRSANAMGRYNTIECVHATLGFGLGLVAMHILGPGAEAVVIGLLLAAALCSIVDARLMLSPLRRAAGRLDRSQLIRLVEYAWPVVAVAATAMIMQNSDRFLLGSLGGVGMLGIFAVAYNLVERPTTIICSSISTATFPLVVSVLEHQGKEAARLQAGRNGVALLAASLPACVGLAMTADYIAATLVGPAFREGVAELIPIMAFTALARGLRSHFIDHAFHLSGKPLMMLWTYVPATIANVVLNLIFIPQYGMVGAAWTAFACQTATVVAGWFLGTSLFPVWLPVGQFLRCVAAVLPMAAGLALVQFPLSWGGLCAAVALGGTLYAVAALALDVGEVRTLGSAALRRRLRHRTPVLTE